MTQAGVDPVANPVAPLRLVASSIAGCMLDVRAVTAGEPAWTDGRSVYVDATLPRRRQVQSVSVQAALIAAGSLAPEIMRRLGGRAALTTRYLAVEAPRALAVVEDRLPPTAVSLLVRRIGADDRTAADSLTAALAGRGVADVSGVFGTIRPRALLGGVLDPPSTVPAKAPARRARPRTLVDPVDERGDEDGGWLDALTDPAGGGGAFGRFLARMLRFQRNSGSGQLGGEVPPRARRVPATASKGGRTAHASGASGDNRESIDVGADWIYPEWDERRRTYRVDWCTVREEEPPVEGVTPPRGREAALRRPLARLALGLEVAHRRPQGEDIDIDAAIEARVDLAAGVEPADAVYIESLHRRHDLAVLVLLDISGSANEPSSAGGSVYEQQLAGATALVRAVHGLGNRVAVYGFYSQGRSAVRVVRVKRFDDPMSVSVVRRMGNLEPGGYTRLGAAIRHGTELLEARGGGSRRLLLVLSDGFAYDHGYDGRYGEADARKALSEARMRGVGCLCVSIGAATEPAALRRVFGSAAHAAVRNPDELVHVAGPLFRDALRSAEVQRYASYRARLASRRTA